MASRAIIDCLPIYIGYDSREPQAYYVARSSILRHATRPVHIMKLDERALRFSGLYKRRWHTEGTQKIDDGDGKPFSTEFSFTRFLVPALCQWQGWALFVDSDFLFKTDIKELIREADCDKAVMVAKQDYVPKSDTKMDGQVQQKYYRKNWSSFMLFNCSHTSTKMLTPDAVNMEPGSWLHGFGWCPDMDIGAVRTQWNWIDGTTKGDPLAVHYTTGGPWFEHLAKSNAPFFQDWRDEARAICVASKVRQAA